MSSKGSVLDEVSERHYYRKNIYELSVSEFKINILYSPKFEIFEVYLNFYDFANSSKSETILFWSKTWTLICQF